MEIVAGLRFQVSSWRGEVPRRSDFNAKDPEEYANGTERFYSACLCAVLRVLCVNVFAVAPVVNRPQQRSRSLRTAHFESDRGRGLRARGQSFGGESGRRQVLSTDGNAQAWDSPYELQSYSRDGQNQIQPSRRREWFWR